MREIIAIFMEHTFIKTFFFCRLSRINNVFFLCDSSILDSINKLSFLFLSDVFQSIYWISIVRFSSRIWAWWLCWNRQCTKFHTSLTQVYLYNHVATLAWIFMSHYHIHSIIWQAKLWCLFNISAFFDFNKF